MIESGILYIVATPIGNLGDISFRAVNILQEVALIAAEDTRHSAFLLNHYQIQTPLISLHKFNESKRVDLFLEYLQQGKSIALISDAGTPLISDPGAFLVTQLQAARITIVPVPGCCALIAALSASGLPTDHFVFEGFLPAKPAERRKCLAALCAETRTLIFYEAPHRILASVEDLAAVFGADRPIVLAKELTKTFETFWHGGAGDALTWLTSNPAHQKGEFVVLVQGAKIVQTEAINPEALRILDILSSELPLKQAAALTAKITGEKKNRLYAKVISH